MRLMTGSARRFLVKSEIRARACVARRTISHFGKRTALGMGIVAPGARTRISVFRMIGAHVCVTVLTSVRRRSSDVVRIMAVFAVSMGFGELRPENVHVLVTRFAVYGGRLCVVMRAMTRDAFGVSLVEQRRLRDHWLLRSVTGSTSLPGFGRRSVLTGVTRSATTDRVLALGRVEGGNGLVARSTRRRLGSGGFMWRMTRQTIPRAVDHDGIELSLRARVTA